MAPAVTLLLVMLATFGLACSALAALTALAVGAGLGRGWRGPNALLALRLMPAAGALLLVFGVALPAFVMFEPQNEAETVGPVVALLAAAGFSLLAGGLLRGLAAWRATRRLLRDAGARRASQPVEILDGGPPLVAAVGALKPRILASRSVLEACDAAEFREVIAHERAHVAARDNLKLLLLVCCPDPLAWLALGGVLQARWRVAAEYSADERAAGRDPLRRVDLASALIKVARLSHASWPRARPLELSVAADDVEGRVRSLLAPPPPPAHSRVGRTALAAALAVALAAIPLYAAIHEGLEALIALGS